MSAGFAWDSLFITVVYTALLAWGVGVGIAQVWQGLRRPDALLNPLFRNKYAQWLFAVHLIIVSADLFVCGPLALAVKSPHWYWGGRIALLTASLPLAAFLNRNPQSFGKLIGRWVVFRNLFEVAMHVGVAAFATDWFWHYLLLWWLVAYRYLDVGPRRLLQTLYATPERLARRPWAPALNWAFITLLYGLSFLAVYFEKILYAAPPAAGMPEHAPQGHEIALIVGINVLVAVVMWVLTRMYSESLVREASKPTASA